MIPTELIKNCLLGTMYPDALKPVYGANTRTIPVRLMMLVDSIIKRFGFRVAVYQEASASDGTHWPAIALTMVGRKRLDNIEQLCEQVEKDQVPGAWVECGVWRGGASILARLLLDSAREVILCDSFDGLPFDAMEPEWSRHDYMRVSVEQARFNFQQFGADWNVKYIKGWFDQTLPKIKQPIAILRADGDMYSSTMDILSNLYPRAVKGGFVIIDDYHLPMCKSAVDFYRDHHKITDPIVDIDGKGIYWRKR